MCVCHHGHALHSAPLLPHYASLLAVFCVASALHTSQALRQAFSLALPHPCCHGAPSHLCVAAQVQLSNGLAARVAAIDNEAGEITLDLNHRLAGKHLTFDVTLLALTAGDSLQKATFGAGCFWG